MPPSNIDLDAASTSSSLYSDSHDSGFKFITFEGLTSCVRVRKELRINPLSMALIGFDMPIHPHVEEPIPFVELLYHVGVVVVVQGVLMRDDVLPSCTMHRQYNPHPFPTMSTPTYTPPHTYPPHRYNGDHVASALHRCAWHQTGLHLSATSSGITASSLQTLTSLLGSTTKVREGCGWVVVCVLVCFRL